MHPVACGNSSWEESLVSPAVPPGWRMAFSCGRKASRRMSLVVYTGSPTRSQPRKKIDSLVPMGAVWTGSVASTHSRYGRNSS